MLYCVVVFLCKQKTAYEMRISDWSSDVCSSDLHVPVFHVDGYRDALHARHETLRRRIPADDRLLDDERRAGRLLEAAFRETRELVANIRQIGRASCRERVCQYE